MSDVRDEVVHEVRQRFSADAQPHVLRALSSMSEPPATSPDRSRERARVQLAIIKLAGGDLGRLLAHVKASQIDWRDTLCAAGLETAGWRQVLRDAGFRAPD